MVFLIGLLMLLVGLYRFYKEIKKDKVGINIFNSYWKSKRNTVIYVLILGGTIMCLQGLGRVIRFLIG